ncbi:hypothetical protein GSI_07075 [Ganoderma sinense ZZ0214-1]|uniref:Uncharacterized protein n=1 Tax=Ganoderma sinense ZZ0214-1 TaxID=1077348 RepID=A0A2G8SAW6_9APHY|nr:hypothetical protein GSI_07075 [Ganoderma sinense ZZ0214-1]
MSRLQSLFKSSASTSSQASSSSSSRRSSASMMVDASPISYVQFTGLAPTPSQKPAQAQSGTSNGGGYAEMLDEDNMAWVKPKKASRRS